MVNLLSFSSSFYIREYVRLYTVSIIIMSGLDVQIV